MSDADALPAKEQMDQQIDEVAFSAKWPESVVVAVKAAVADVHRVTNQQAKAALMNDVINPWYSDESKSVADLKAAL